MIRVLIVDDQQLVREGIASLLALQAGIEVVGTATNGEVCIAAAAAQEPDVILLDIRMPVMDGISAAAELRARGSTARILMLTTFDDEEYVVKALRAGAAGYLMKDLPVEDLARAVNQVFTGTFPMAPGVVSVLMNRVLAAEEAAATRPAPDPAAQRLWKSLTDRERDVLGLLSRGATNREIADTLFLSEGTVKNYVSDILAALDVRDRTQAALMAVRNKWDQFDVS